MDNKQFITRYAVPIYIILMKNKVKFEKCNLIKRAAKPFRRSVLKNLRKITTTNNTDPL